MITDSVISEASTARDSTVRLSQYRTSRSRLAGYLTSSSSSLSSREAESEPARSLHNTMRYISVPHFKALP
eukprot:831829-Rhodomonas_salina.1